MYEHPPYTNPTPPAAPMPPVTPPPPPPAPVYYAPPVYPPRPPKPLLPLSKGDIAFAVLAVVVGVLWSAIGLFGGMALGYTISVAAVMLLLSIYLKKGGRLTLFSMVSGGLALGLGAVFLCTGNESVRFYATILGFLLGFCCFHSMTVGSAAGNRETLGIFYTAAATTGNIGVTIKSLFSNEKGEKRALGKALLGLVCALPALLLILPLLLSSDYAFQGMMSSLFSDGVLVVFKCIFGLGIALLMAAYGLSLKHRRTEAMGEGRFSGIEGVYIFSFLSVIGVLYLMYLFSQLAYFFSAFRGFLPQGDITVAEYARKGFFEMSALAGINLGLVITAMLLAKKKEGKVSLPIRGVCTFISLFTLVLIATALSKMVLYIGSFGMTELRLTTSAFMVLLAVVFLATILRLYFRRINVIKTALITAGLLVLVLGVGNVNAICARYNYEAWKSGDLDEIDVAAMYELGDEGIPYLVQLADCDHVDVSDEARDYLKDAFYYDYFCYDEANLPHTMEVLKSQARYTAFSEYSLPRGEAYRCLYAYYESHPEFALLCWPPEPYGYVENDDYFEDDYYEDDYYEDNNYEDDYPAEIVFPEEEYDWAVTNENNE